MALVDYRAGLGLNDLLDSRCARREQVGEHTRAMAAASP